MDKHLEQTLQTTLSTYHAWEEQLGDRAQLLEEALGIFGSEASFMEKVALLDDWVDEHPRLEELREILFDLLLMNFLAADVQRLEEDYLESAEWEEIEDQTIDRGTELLNLLLYLRECMDEEIEATLEDFLKEFLLVDEDEFQDEYHIYEPIIANQMLLESSYGEIAKVGKKLDEDQDLAAIFYPVMSFFFEQKPNDKQVAEFVDQSANKAFDAAVYQLIVSYYHQK